jgi:hypothetical protein
MFVPLFREKANHVFKICTYPALGKAITQYGTQVTMLSLGA